MSRATACGSGDGTNLYIDGAPPQVQVHVEGALDGSAVFVAYGESRGAKGFHAHGEIERLLVHDAAKLVALRRHGHDSQQSDFGVADGSKAMFASVDSDSSGELDLQAFTQMVEDMNIFDSFIDVLHKQKKKKQGRRDSTTRRPSLADLATMRKMADRWSAEDDDGW